MEHQQDFFRGNDLLTLTTVSILRLLFVHIGRDGQLWMVKSIFKINIKNVWNANCWITNGEYKMKKSMIVLEIVRICRDYRRCLLNSTRHLKTKWTKLARWLSKSSTVAIRGKIISRMKKKTARAIDLLWTLTSKRMKVEGGKLDQCTQINRQREIIFRGVR